MRLFIDEDIDRVGQEIQQAKSSVHGVLRAGYDEALATRRLKQERAKAMLVASQQEIDSRFRAKKDIEWAQFNV